MTALDPIALKQALAGDPAAREALGSWCLRHAFDVAFIVLGRIPNRETVAEDVASEATYKALANLDGFDPNSHFTAWLNTIVRNCACSYFRRETRGLPPGVYQRWAHDFLALSREELEAMIDDAAGLDAASRGALLERIERDVRELSYDEFMQRSYSGPAERVLERVKEGLRSFVGLEPISLNAQRDEESLDDALVEQSPTEAGLMQEEFVAEVNARLATLDPLCRRLIRWFYLERLRMAEIARLEQWTERTAYRRLKRCAAAFRARLTSDGYFAEFARGSALPVTEICRNALEANGASRGARGGVPRQMTTGARDG